MRVNRDGMSPEAAAEAATQGIEVFLTSIGVATRLRDLGVREADLQAIAAANASEPAFGEDSHAPRDLEELAGILQQAW